MMPVRSSAPNVVVSAVQPGDARIEELCAVVIGRMRTLLPGATIEAAGIAHARLDSQEASVVPSGEYGLSAAIRRASVVVVLAPDLRVMGIEDPAMAFDAPLPEWPAAYLTRLLLLARAYDVPAVVWAPKLAAQPNAPATRLLSIALEGAMLVPSESDDASELCCAIANVIERATQGRPEAPPQAPLLSPGQDARDLAESLRDYVRFLGAPQPGSGPKPAALGRQEPPTADVLAELRQMHAVAESARAHQIRLLEDLSTRLTFPRMIMAPARWLRRILRRS